MNRHFRWGFALALLPLAACNTDRSNAFSGTVPQPLPAAVTTNAQDGRFITNASSSDLFETQTAQAALQKSRSAAVRAYAQMIMDHHSMSSQQLTQLASAKGASVSQGLDPTQQRLLAAANGASGSNFDRTYLGDQVTAHTATVLSYNDEIKSGLDPDVKAFAQQNLPMIQQHLQEARRLSGRR